MKLLGLMYMILITQTTANAASIKQLLNDQNLAIIQLKNGEKIAVGENFIVSEDKTQCLLEVLSVDDRIVTVSSKACSDKSILSIGKSVEKSLFEAKFIQPELAIEAPKSGTPEPESAPAAKVEEKKPEPPTKGDGYSAFYVGYMLNPKILINLTATAGTSSERGSFEFKFSNAVNFGFEASQFKRQAWNNGFFLDYAALKFDSVTISGASSGSSSGSMTGGMTFLTVAYAGKYRWETFYFPVNIGILSTAVDSTGTFTKTMSARLLVSYGFGFAMSESFNLELIGAATSITSSTTTASGTTIVPEIGYLTYTQINAKFLF